MQSFARPVLFLGLLVSGAMLAAHAAGDGGMPDPADRIIGLWATDKAEAHVEIYRSGESKYSGRIVWLKDPFYPEDDDMAGQPKLDRENPDPELRSRPVKGLEIIQDFVYDGDDRWTDGKIYDPENGKTYSSKMWLTERGNLKVRGYIGISLFGRTTEWTPVFGGGSGTGATEMQSDDAPEGDGEAIDPDDSRDAGGPEDDAV